MRAIMLLAAALTGFSITAAIAASDADGFHYWTQAQGFATVAKPAPKGSATTNYISNHDDFKEGLVQRTTSGKVELHDFYSDYMVIVDGKGTLTVGGAIKDKQANPNGQAGEWLGASSSGGKVYDLVPGALLIIPKGIPHWMQLPPGGHIRYITFKRKG